MRNAVRRVHGASNTYFLQTNTEIAACHTRASSDSESTQHVSEFKNEYPPHLITRRKPLMLADLDQNLRVEGSVHTFRKVALLATLASLFGRTLVSRVEPDIIDTFSSSSPMELDALLPHLCVLRRDNPYSVIWGLLHRRCTNCSSSGDGHAMMLIEAEYP